MSLLEALGRTMYGRAAPRRVSRPGRGSGGCIRRLAVEGLESRLCLSPGPYLFVTSYANNSVMRYDEITGEPAPVEGQGGATFVPSRSCGLNAPLDLLFTPDGDLVVGSAEDQSIIRFDGMTGDCQSDFIDRSGSLLSFPTGMIFSSDSTAFFVANNNGNRKVLHYDYDGSSGINGRAIISDPGMNGPVGMVFGPDGYLYVSSLTSNDVRRYDASSGDLIDVFVSGIDVGLMRPGGVVFGPDGNLYVASQRTNEILRFDGTTGAPLPADGEDGAVFVHAGSGKLSDPAGILFGPDDNLYVVSINTSNVLCYDGTSGAFIDEFVAAGSGGLSAPRDLAFGSTDPSTLNYVHSGGNTLRGNILALLVNAGPADSETIRAASMIHDAVPLSPAATNSNWALAVEMESHPATDRVFALAEPLHHAVHVLGAWTDSEGLISRSFDVR